jgi:nucleoside-diphosphate-sugar epimerase
VNFLGYEPDEVRADAELFRGRIGQYVFISSATVYAKPPPSLPITESTPRANPWWDYAQKKIACEEWLEAAARNTGFPVTIVRPSHTYSKRWIPNPVSSSSYTFAARLEAGKPVYVHDDGQTPWTLTAASDFAIGLAGLLGHQEALGQAFHLTGDEVLTWNSIYLEIASALGVNPPEVVRIPTDFICQVAPRFTGTLKGDKAHPGVFDNSRIKRLVPAFATRKPFSVGVRESIDWLRAHPQHQNLSADLDGLIEHIPARWRAHGSSDGTVLKQGTR